MSERASLQERTSPWAASVSTCALIADHAARRPQDAAFIGRDVHVTYGRLAVDIISIRGVMMEAGIRSGQVIGVEAADRYLHCLILLAAETLGVATLSLDATDRAKPENGAGLCHRILAADPALDLPIGRRGGADPAADLRPLSWPVDPDSVARLNRSSGTTGVPKVMAMTHRVQQRAIAKLDAPGMRARPCFLCIYTFAVRAVILRTLYTLQKGGTVNLTGSDLLVETLAAGVGDYLLFVAGDLERCLRTMPDGVGPFPVHVDVIGAAIPRRLRTLIRDKLSTDLSVSYSSNETNRISLIDDDGVGTLLPDAAVRIVDAAGAPVPLGETGLIRVRTDTMTTGYIGEPALTRASFIDGWFQTADIGYQPSETTLVVLGRGDEMMNIGGVKIAPQPIEDQLKALPDVTDAVVIAVIDQMESSVMLVVIETPPATAAPALRDAVTGVMQGYVRQFQLLVLPAFPRTLTGKVQREAVRALYRERVQAIGRG